MHPPNFRTFMPDHVPPPANKLLLPLSLCLAASLAIFARIDDISYIEDSLWYDDRVFINESYELGLRSLWEPFLGYQFIYLRIVAQIAHLAPLEFTPFIFCSGWYLSFLSIVYVLNVRGKSVDLDIPSLLFLITAIAIQPNHGESFFNLTHAQFFLGVALAIYVCIPSFKPASISELLFLCVASLSGPFSIILATALLIQLTALRDFSSRKSIYTIVFTCAIIQSTPLINPSYLEHPPTVLATHWKTAILSFLAFGQHTPLAYVAATIFWCVTSIHLVRFCRDSIDDADKRVCLIPVSAAICAVLSFVLSVLRAGDRFAGALSPTDYGSRYFLIPYSLLFFVATLCTRKHTMAQVAALSSIGLLCGAAFVTVDRADRASSVGLLSHSNMQWTAFAKLQSVRPDTLIPINAPLPMFPPLYVQPKQPSMSYRESPGTIDSIPLVPQYISSPAVGDTPSVRSPLAYFNLADHCKRSEFLSLEIHLWRARMGWASVSWGQPGSLDSRRTLKRFYPSGATVMQFAFRRRLSDSLVWFFPAEGVPPSSIVKAVNALKDTLPLGTVVGVPTSPGGEVRIERVSLLCLS